jgi:hypothetical protein
MRAGLRSQASRSTPYADELATADINGKRIERLFLKETEKDEKETIRFSWWKDGKFAPRPLEISEGGLLDLISEAINEGVFSEPFLKDPEAMLRTRTWGRKIMPRGPRGERRPADVVGTAVKVAKIATGQIEEDRDEPQSAAA